MTLLGLLSEDIAWYLNELLWEDVHDVGDFLRRNWRCFSLFHQRKNCPTLAGADYTLPKHQDHETTLIFKSYGAEEH